jgi:hypothetical protein
VRLVVGSLSVTHHGHDVGERHAGTVVLIGVEEDTKTLEFVRRTENRALSRTLFGKPKRKPITMQVPGAMDFKLELDLEKCVSLRAFGFSRPRNYLPIGRSQRHARGNPSLLRWSVGRQADISNHKRQP